MTALPPLRPAFYALSGLLFAAPGIAAFVDWQGRGCTPWPITRTCADGITAMGVTGLLALVLFGAALRRGRRTRHA